MFKAAVNTPFNNTVFSGGTIHHMHETTERLYQAALQLRKTQGQSNVARLLNESPQTIKNWESRGVSRPGAIKAQSAIGVSATWVLTGEGAMTPTLAVTSAPVDRPFYEVHSEDDQTLLDNWNTLPDDEKARFFKEIAERADKYRAYLAKHMEKAGLPAPKSAAERTRMRKSSTEVPTTPRKREKHDS